MLAPLGYKKASSYIIGWLTSLAWIATVATESLFAGTIVQGILLLRYPGYDGARWQGTLLTWFVIVTNVLINVITPGLIPKFELFWMIVHIGAYIAVLASLLSSTPEFSSPHTVFLTALNEGGWSSQGLSYCVGFLGNVATFVGADASVHMAEEVDNAALNIPRAIVTAMLVNGLIGFGMMITTLFCLGDVGTDRFNSVVDTELGFPFIQIFANSYPTVAGAVAVASIVLALTWACALGITTTASRMTWSFARDKGTPLSKLLSKVSRRTHVPYMAVFAVCIIAALLCLIYIGSSVAFNDVISLTITGFYGSYFLPCALLLYHRIKGNIMPYGTEPDPDMQGERLQEKEGLPAEHVPPTMEPAMEPKLSHAAAEVKVAQARLIWGPWRIPGILGIINNAYACTYMIFVIFWSVWPPATPVTASTMNYSVVVTGGVMILSGLWYWIRARHVYKGPIVDESVASAMRRGSVVVAQ
jgi:choline transport protein